MERKLGIKPLVEYYSAAPYPWGIFVDALIARFDHLRFLNAFRPNIAQPHKDILEIGFHGFELGLWAGALFDKDWNVDGRRLKAYANSGHNFKRFHACFEMLPESLHGMYFNLADGNPENIKALKAQILAASILSKGERTIIVLHPGFVKEENDKQKGIKSIVSVIQRTLDFAKKKNVVLSLENMPHVEGYTFIGADPRDIKEIVNHFNSPWVKATFDWGHLNIYAHFYHKNNSTQFINDSISMLGRDIVHAHLNYNRCCERVFIPDGGAGSSNFMRGIYKKVVGSSGHDFSSLPRYDQHMPFSKAEGGYGDAYRQNIEQLLTKSSILSEGFLTHEIEPKKIFGFIEHNKEGAEIHDHKKDLVILKELVSKVQSNLEKSA